MAEIIHVPATLPPTPLVLADAEFLTKLVAVEAEVSALAVTSPETAQTAATLLSRLTSANTKLEATRKAIKQPFLDIGRKIDDIAATTASRINRSRDLLKRRLTEWNDKELARLAEIERQRQAEIARLEAAAKREREEAERKAAEAAKAAQAANPDAEVMDFDFDGEVEPVKTETEKKADALRYAPAPVAQRPTGVAFKQRLTFKITDVRALPETFLVILANETKIRETYCVGWQEGQPLPVLPGVEFTVEKTAVSSGRRV